MKNIKIYENFLDEIDTHRKCKMLATFICDFINNIDSKSNCKIEKLYSGSYMVNNENDIQINVKKIIIPDEFGPDDYDVEVLFYKFLEPNIISKFIYNQISKIAEFSNWPPTSTGIKDNIDTIKKSLTKDEYEKYLLELDTEKYNL